MQQWHGWCPSKASPILGKFYSLQAKIYISKIAKPYKDAAHDACSFESCRAPQLNLPTYNALHCHPNSCKGVESNQEEVFKVLKEGKNALLDLKLNPTLDEVSIAIVAANPYSWYVALSHVWADGLGNPKENSLPQCRLCRIYHLLTSFCTEKFIKGTQKRPYLWLDTLCSPVNPDDKLLTLAKMP